MREFMLKTSPDYDKLLNSRFAGCLSLKSFKRTNNSWTFKQKQNCSTCLARDINFWFFLIKQQYPKFSISKVKGCSPHKFISSSSFSLQQFQLKVSWQAPPVKTWSGCSGFCVAPAWNDEITDTSAEWKVHLQVISSALAGITAAWRPELMFQRVPMNQQIWNNFVLYVYN